MDFTDYWQQWWLKISKSSFKQRCSDFLSPIIHQSESEDAEPYVNQNSFHYVFYTFMHKLMYL